MKNKKKIFAIALFVALIAIVSLVSLAWFTDTDEVTNVFTFGEVSITMHDEDGDGNPFNGEDGLTKQPLLPGVPVDKVVYASNDGNPNLPGNEAYVRAFIGVPEKLDSVLKLTFDKDEKWTKDSDSYIAEIDGVRYKVYQFTYNTPLEAGQDTSKVLEKVELDEQVDIKNGKLCIPNEDGEGYTYFDFDINALREMKIPVAMQAVQVKGFDNAAAAFDSAFDGCPWDEAEAENPADFSLKIDSKNLNKTNTLTWIAPAETGFDKIELIIPAGAFEEPVELFVETSESEEDGPCLVDFSFYKIDENGNRIKDGDDDVVVDPPYNTEGFKIDIYSPYPQVGEGNISSIIGFNWDNPFNAFFFNVWNAIEWHQTTTD